MVRCLKAKEDRGREKGVRRTGSVALGSCRQSGPHCRMHWGGVANYTLCFGCFQPQC